MRECVCVRERFYVCFRARERKIEREKGIEREREIEREGEKEWRGRLREKEWEALLDLGLIICMDILDYKYPNGNYKK